MPKNYKYTLNQNEWVKISELAYKRNNIKISGTSKKFDNGKSDLRIHIYGMAAEYSFAKIMNLKPSLDAQKGGDLGYDFILDNSLTIDVKYRFNRNKDFALNTDKLKDFKADIGVLMWPGLQNYCFELIGWTSRLHFAYFSERHYLKDWRLLIPWKKMRDPSELLNIIKLSIQQNRAISK